MNFDIVIPTFKREEKLYKLLESIPQNKNYIVYVYFDNNDAQTYQIIKANFPQHNYIIMDKKYQAFGIWNYHLQNNFNSDIFIYLCDDTSLYKDTLINVEKHFNEKFPDTDGMVTFNQVNIKGSDSAMGCVGRKFIERYKDKQIFCKNYVSFYADSELGDYAKKLGKFHFGGDCRINHYHPGFYKELKDEAHDAIRGEDKNIDIKINKLRKEKNLLWGESYEIIDRSSV